MAFINGLSSTLSDLTPRSELSLRLRDDDAVEYDDAENEDGVGDLVRDRLDLDRDDRDE